MKDHKQTSEYTDHSYSTGATQPPKNHGGLIALLLGLVIFLCGISTALGLMNIKLFQQLQDQNNTQPDPVAFSCSPDAETVATDAANHFSLGFSGIEITPFWSQLEDIPQGIYITEVDSRAAHQLAAGDILLRLNGTPITQQQTLHTLLNASLPGEAAEAVIYRDGEEITITLSIESLH